MNPEQMIERKAIKRSLINAPDEHGYIVAMESLLRLIHAHCTDADTVSLIKACMPYVDRTDGDGG